MTGAGQGIGRASALMLAREGIATLVLSDVNAAGLEKIAAEVAALGARPVIQVADLSSSDDAIRMYEAAEAAAPLDIIHNNAGIMGGPPDFPDANLNRMIAAIQINLIAMMIGTTLGMKFMRARGKPGVIINTSSVAAFGILPADPAYAASKHGVLALSQSCKPFAETYGIRVVPLCPAITDTAIVAKDAPWLKPMLQQVKLLQPEDIAAEIKRIIEDDTLAGDAVVVSNQPADA